MTSADDPLVSRPLASGPTSEPAGGFGQSRPVASLDTPESIAAEVSARIEEFLESKSAEFLTISPDAADIGRALVDFTRGGKRIRPVLLWWGYQLVSELGFDETSLTAGVADAAGSLELLHAAALIHDDVIDHSDTRRGSPALHRQFESRHRERAFQGEGESFGVAAAIVIGDICLALSEELFERSQATLGITASARELRATIRRDVMVGQYLDVLAEVIPLDDERIGDRAWEVLSFKSAKYSVEQPLLLGAALGGASEEQLTEISRFGLPLGQAFQLRDDVLGIFGDPEATGKPAGDDIREGKRTVLIAESMKNLAPDQIRLLAERLGDPKLSDTEVAECVAMLADAGGLKAVEDYIDAKHAEALAVIDSWASGDEALASESDARVPRNTGPPNTVPRDAEAGRARVRIGAEAKNQLTAFADALSYRQK